jgi:hypothetical protein
MRGRLLPQRANATFVAVRRVPQRGQCSRRTTPAHSHLAAGPLLVLTVGSCRFFPFVRIAERGVGAVAPISGPDRGGYWIAGVSCRLRKAFACLAGSSPYARAYVRLFFIVCSWTMTASSPSKVGRPEELRSARFSASVGISPARRLRPSDVASSKASESVIG